MNIYSISHHLQSSFHIVIQVQGFKFDPEGEYVRQWLPELARMPTEWIHHPWDAPLSILKSSGIELGINYPKPIMDIDIARDRLTQAISVMHGKEATGKGATNGADEVVFDNSETPEKFPLSKAVANENKLHPASSSHDQRVPSMRISMSATQNRKRLKPEEDGKKNLNDNLNSCNNGDRVSKRDDDLCSTAESSSSKKAMTKSRNYFSVPQNCSSMSTTGVPFPVHESSDLNFSWQEEVGTEETSSKNGKKCT